jgi:hypothetical protein
LHGELDVDKLKDTQTLLKTAGGPPLWKAYNDVKNEKQEGIKYVDVVRMIHEHLGEQGLLKKWTRPLTQEEIDNHFDSVDGVTAKEVKSVQHNRLDSDFAKKRKPLKFQSVGDIGGGDAKLHPNLHQPRESGTPQHKS